MTKRVSRLTRGGFSGHNSYMNSLRYPAPMDGVANAERMTEVQLMNRLVFVAICLVTAGFAPAPLFNFSERDLNKLLGAFENDVQEAVTDPAALDAIARRQKVLQLRLNRHIVSLRQREMHDEADAVHDTILVLDSIDGAQPAGQVLGGGLADEGDSGRALSVAVARVVRARRPQ